MTLVGCMWVFGVVAAGLVLRPRSSRRLESAPVGESQRVSVEALGSWALHALRREPTPVRSRQAGALLLFVLPALAIDFRLGVLAAALAIIMPISRARRKTAERHDGVLQELPEVIDLLTVAVAGGLTVPLAVAAVARRVPGQLAEAFHESGEQAGLGRRLADELERVPDALGDVTRPLIRALVAAERYGTPIVDSLGRVGTDVRIERRRRAEIAARRLPIKLLFPLVACVLPAFVLLTVVPVLAGSFEAIRG